MIVRNSTFTSTCRIPHSSVTEEAFCLFGLREQLSGPLCVGQAAGLYRPRGWDPAGLVGWFFVAVQAGPFSRISPSPPSDGSHVAPAVCYSTFFLPSVNSVVNLQGSIVSSYCLLRRLRELYSSLPPRDCILQCILFCGNCGALEPNIPRSSDCFAPLFALVVVSLPRVMARTWRGLWARVP